MSANQAKLSVQSMCRVLDVSASGYYAWQGRAPSKRATQDTVLTERIRLLHAASDENYGSPNIHADLRDEGTRVGRKRVARLMKVAGLRGISRRRSFVVTTQRDRRQRPAPDLVNREFTADGPNQLWVADMTYIPTWAGFIYLAVVVDVWSRRIVGWSFSETMTSDLVLAALNMALELRKPEGVIHHSDQGSQYTSIAFGNRCKEMGVRPSMGTVGDAYDNAMAESVFASLECELIDRRSFKTKTEARLAVFTWIEAWYNPRRRHSAHGRISPINFERLHADKLHRAPSVPHGLPTAALGRIVASADRPPPWTYMDAPSLQGSLTLSASRRRLQTYIRPSIARSALALMECAGWLLNNSASSKLEVHARFDQPRSYLSCHQQSIAMQPVERISRVLRSTC